MNLGYVISYPKEKEMKGKGEIPLIPNSMLNIANVLRIVCMTWIKKGEPNEIKSGIQKTYMPEFISADAAGFIRDKQCFEGISC